MRVVYAIMLKELKCDVASLKFAAMLFFTLLLMGIFFFGYMDAFVGLSRNARELGAAYPNLKQMLSSFYGIFHIITVLLVPAMTMASFAEEYHSQTIKLFLTSPVRAWQLVVGKFCALLLAAAALLGAAAAFPLYLWAYGQPDGGQLLSCYLGLSLLLASHLAFGMWVSSLVQQQFLAFLFSMLGLFSLLVLNTLTQTLPAAGLGYRLLKSLAAGEHLSPFLQGYFLLSDVVYFLIFTMTFLALTCQSYQALRGS